MLSRGFFDQGEDVKCFFHGYGSFGEIHGTVRRDGQRVYQETGEYRLECVWERDEYGVFTRRDSFENISDHPITLHSLHSRFIFDGGEYEVYTQFNTWQNESAGGWQPLVTAVTATGASSRTAQDAAPFLALWSAQEQRGAAFHLIPNAAWEMKAVCAGYSGKLAVTVVEMGILDYNFDVTLQPGEVIRCPEIICYEAGNRTDLDCWKLHNYMHTRCPRRKLPMIYNTWLYRFDHITFDNIAAQIPYAAELGLEYFFIDAGWFGKGKSWASSAGDWVENTTGAFCGRMAELADAVRAAGMQFGIWLEPERADPQSDAVREHPEFFIPGDVEASWYFLDFADEKAREWMLGVIFGLIERYGVAYIKDDYNADMYFDRRHTAFLRYHEGHAAFMRAIRERYPDIYLSSCASGGDRMHLGSYIEFDSNWPSDNESPYLEMRMYRDTILRYPPQGFERWICAHSLGGFEDFYAPFADYHNGRTERMVACGDAVWKHLEGVEMSYLKGYLTGGPAGFSCDLSRLSPTARAAFRDYIAGIKADREFWKTAVARILCDTPSVTVFQYSDMPLSRIVVQLFTDMPRQDRFRVYPVTDAARRYRLGDGTVRSGRELAEEGIELTSPRGSDNWHEMLETTLEAVGG